MNEIASYKARLLKEAQDAAAMGDASGRKILDLAADGVKIAALIELLSDPDTPDTKKVATIDKLSVIRIFSKALPTRSAELTNALRGLMDSENSILRRKAIASLIAAGDTVVQQKLQEELISDKSEQERSVPTHQAIAMLGTHDKGLDKASLLKIAKSPPDEESLVQAIRHLPADTETSELLIEILEDHTKPIAARSLVPELMLQNDPGALATSAKKILEEEGAESPIAPFLARGIAGISSTEELESILETRLLIKTMAPASSDEFREAAAPLILEQEEASKE